MAKYFVEICELAKCCNMAKHAHSEYGDIIILPLSTTPEANSKGTLGQEINSREC
jgi:hypothetical protein